MPIAVIYIFAVMLLIGATQLPYGYYILLRLVAFGIFTFAAYVSFDRKNKTLPWVYGLLALIFNPLIKIHLSKELWALVDVGAGVMLLATAKEIQTNV